MNFESLNIALPPPWREISDGSKVYYLNEVTGEESENHPFYKIESLLREYSKVYPDETGGNDPEFSQAVEEADDLNQNNISNSKKMDYLEFKCHWQEVDLLGKKLSYSLLMRFFTEDNHVEVNFEGIDGKWIFSYLEGLYGPVERYDLFIGAQIKLFGRHLTIASANANICNWIDKKAKKFEKRKAWLQKKIESIGAVPIIRRNPPNVTRNILREHNSSGRSNLRKIVIEIAKLSEQLNDLGLGHFLEMAVSLVDVESGIYSESKLSSAF